MRRILENPHLILLLRLGFGAMYLVAAYDKILNPDDFAVAVDNYHLLPRVLVNLWALALPWTEAAIGLFLIAGIFTEAAALLSTLLCVAFLIALSQAMIRGFDISCGCFSTDPGAERASPWLLARDVLLVLGSLWILLYNDDRFSLSALFKGGNVKKGVQK